MFEPGITKHLKEALATYSSIKVNHPLTCTLFMESPWHECNRFLSEQSQLVPRTPYHDKDLAALMYRSPPELRTNKEISKRLIADGSKALANIPTDRGVGGKYPPPISIVPRLYNEFFFKSEYYYNYGMPQWLSKIDYTLKSLHIEKVFLGRHKFYHFRVWYRDQLAKFVKEILLDERTLSRPYLNRTFVEHIVEAHTKGYRNYTTEITKLLTIELIHRNLIEDL
jgi:asparagine synthase (glutamine-hydrolysing)